MADRSFRRTRPIRRGRHADRGGVALMLALSVLFVASLLTVGVLDSITLDLAALRRQIAYEQALLMAQAGVHAVVAELTLDSDFNGSVAQGTLGADDAYQASVALRDGNVVVIEGAGSAGGFTRRITAKVQL